MAKTVDEFVAQLERFGQQARDMASILQTIGNEEVQKIKQDYGRNGLKIETGALFNSIQATVNETTLTFSMLDYGAYNNYGVMPTPSYKNGGNAPFATPSGKQFRYTKRKFGLPSRQFYDETDIKQRMLLRLEEELTREFN